MDEETKKVTWSTRGIQREAHWKATESITGREGGRALTKTQAGQRWQGGDKAASLDGWRQRAVCSELWETLRMWTEARHESGTKMKGTRWHWTIPCVVYQCAIRVLAGSCRCDLMKEVKAILWKTGKWLSYSSKTTSLTTFSRLCHPSQWTMSWTMRDPTAFLGEPNTGTLHPWLIMWARYFMKQ